jgi:uncharacterized protein (TIGR02453 family)
MASPAAAAPAVNSMSASFPGVRGVTAPRIAFGIYRGANRAIPAARGIIADMSSRRAAPGRNLTPPAAFTGFAKDAPRFFHELAHEMSREWFAEHKAEYEQLWLAPMKSLLGEVARAIKPAYRGVTLGEAKVFRIHRDVRFANDKTPYKTYIAGYLPLVKDAKPTEGAAALYLQLGLEEFAGAGHYGFDPSQLIRWRKLVAADKTGRVIARLCAQARAGGHDLDAREVLTRAPRGVDPDHPRAELLRHKGLVVTFPAIPRGLIHKPGLVGWLAGEAKQAAPVVTWLARNVG